MSGLSGSPSSSAVSVPSQTQSVTADTASTSAVLTGVSPSQASSALADAAPASIILTGAARPIPGPAARKLPVPIPPHRSGSFDDGIYRRPGDPTARNSLGFDKNNGYLSDQNWWDLMDAINNGRETKGT